MTSATDRLNESFRIPLRLRLRRHLRRLPALLVWGGALVAAVFLHQRQERGFQLTGVAKEVRHVVTSTAAGHLSRLEIALGQEVVRGQIVASLDDRDLLLDLQEARAELRRLGAKIAREAGILAQEGEERERERQGLLRRYARDLDAAVLDHLAALADQAEDRIRLQGLALRLSRTEAPVSTATFSQARLDADRTAHDALEKAIAERKTRLAALAAQRREAERRHDTFAKTAEGVPAGTEVSLRPHRHSVEVQEIRIERVNLRISRLVLRAPGAGRVTAAHRRSGEAVAAGEPVLEIIDPRTTEVVVWVPEQRIAEVHPGERVRIQRMTGPGATCESAVAFLGAHIEKLPQRIAPRALSPRWGLPVHIPLPASLAALPGEALGVELIGSRKTEAQP